MGLSAGSYLAQPRTALLLCRSAAALFIGTGLRPGRPARNKRGGGPFRDARVVDPIARVAPDLALPLRLQSQCFEQMLA
jgi:hypothetical protein